MQKTDNSNDDNVVSFPESKKEPQIKSYFHCAKCMDEKPDDISPTEYKNLSVGFYDYGIQVWCDRHDMQVTTINMFDVWEMTNTLKDVRGEGRMPLVRVSPERVPEILIFSGVEGVYIDPIDYWKHSDGFPPENKSVSTVPGEGAGFTCDGCGAVNCECTE